MLVTFDSLPGSARLWIFSAAEKFTSSQVAIITTQLELFTKQWAAHGQPLESSFKIIEERFIMLAVNEDVHAASGCSIDGSVHAIREIGNIIQQDLFRRDLVSFKMGDTIRTFQLNELKDAFNEGLWDENTLTFNTLAASKMQFEQAWLVPAKSLWLKRYFAGKVAL